MNRGETQTAGALLSSTALRDSAIARVPDAKLDQHKDKVFVQAYPTGDKYLRLTIALTKADSDYPLDAASKLTVGLCDSLKAAFEASAKATADVSAGRRAAVAEQLDADKQKLADVRAKLRKARNAGNIPGFGMPGDIDGAARDLDNQKRNTQNDLDRQRAQLAAIDPGSGPLVTEWEQVVQLRQAHLR